MMSAKTGIDGDLHISESEDGILSPPLALWSPASASYCQESVGSHQLDSSLKSAE